MNRRAVHFSQMSTESKTAFFDAGYLSDVAWENVADFNREFGKWRELYEELNGYACKLRRRMAPIRREPLRRPFAICIWNRLLDSYQCVLLLLEKGAGDEAKGVLRSILESLFLLEANANKKTFARRYIIEDQNVVLDINKRALAAALKAKRLGKEQFLSKAQREKIRATVKRLTEERQKREKLRTKKSKKQRRYGPSFNARAAGREMVFEYEKHYALLCSYAHTSVSGNLVKYLTIESPGKLNFHVGPCYDDSIPTLRSAMEFLLMALLSLNKLFSLGETVILEKFEERLQALVRSVER